MDSARETAGKTRDTLAPYAATAKDTALQLADEAKQRLGPTLEALGPKVAAAPGQARNSAAQAAIAARVRYDKHVAPQLGHAFASLPPEAQQSTLKAIHRAQEAALAAKISATRAADQARSTVTPRVVQVVEETRAVIVPAAQEAQIRGAAALTALQGHVSAAEISEIAAKNIKKEQRNGWATGLAVAGTIAIGGGVLAWQWWRRQSSPEWLVEPPTAPGHQQQGSQEGGAQRPGGSHVAGSEASTPLNGSAGAEHSGPDTAATGGGTASGSDRPSPGATPDQPAPHDERPKPHDPRKPH
ncbi:DUF5324 family protein [Kitasatospora sp. NPDC050543]|uniref:DUF5324 family protein n=1 Tax=Kitasatospora sp. NPDC050543 TaxID=3364054 RepID=UPI00379AD2C9